MCSQDELFKIELIRRELIPLKKAITFAYGEDSRIMGCVDVIESRLDYAEWKARKEELCPNTYQQ